MSDVQIPGHDVWPTESLGGLCDIVIGRTPSRNRPELWDGDYPWLSIADMNQGRLIRTTKEKITSLGVSESGSRLIPAGTVLLSFKLSIGKVSVAEIDTFTNEAIAALPILDHEKLSRDFLFWALRSIRLDEEVDAAAKGKTLNKAKLERLEIPLPPLDEQKRIAAVLDKADVLRRQREETLQLTEKLLQSVFIDMFGDPVRNSKNLPTDDLSNLAKLERGKFTPRPRNDPSYFGGPYPFIQTGDITRSKGRITSWTQTLNDKGARVSKEFGRGTVVIAIVGATLGETAIVETPVYCPDSIIGITPFPKKATSEFIEFLLRLWKPRLKDFAPDAARANLNLERLRPLAALAPDIEEQKKFSRVAMHLRELALTKFENEYQLKQLFSSLQQRVFRGELDLSRLKLDVEKELPEVTRLESSEVQGRYKRPGCFIAPPDIEAQMLALENKLQTGPSGSIPWDENYFKFRIVSQVLRPPFSFSDIWQAVKYDMVEASYETVKEMVFEYVAACILEQQFDEERKEIVFHPRP